MFQTTNQMTSSVGMKFPWKKKKCSKPPTRSVRVCVCVFVMNINWRMGHEVWSWSLSTAKYCSRCAKTSQVDLRSILQKSLSYFFEKISAKERSKR